MGFLKSYKALPRYQKIILGACGIFIGWYGPSGMNYLFVEPGVFNINRKSAVSTTTINQTKR